MTVIITNDYFLVDFIFDEFRDDPDVAVVNFKERKNPLTSLLKWLRVKGGNRKGLFNSLLFSRGFRNALASISPADRVLFWSIENLTVSRILAAEIPSRPIVSFLWNPMKRLRRDPRLLADYVRTMEEEQVFLATFDRSDARLLGCRLMPQVHRRIPLPAHPAAPAGVFFVGLLKGREDTLEKIAEELDAHSIPRRFHLLRGRHDRGEVAPVLAGSVAEGPMPYGEVLRCVGEAECLLDIAQSGQTGLTLRALEALFYHKKLITNNPSVKDADFYHPDNVFVVGDPTEKRSLPAFLRDTPFHPIATDIERRHHIRPWLSSLLSGSVAPM